MAGPTTTFDVTKAMVAVLVADVALFARVGARIHSVVPKLVTFPWIRVDFTAAEPLSGTRKRLVRGIAWIDQFRASFVVHTTDRGFANAAAILADLTVVMDFLPASIVIPSGKCFQCLRGAQVVDYDTDTGNAFAQGVWTFAVDPL